MATVIRDPISDHLITPQNSALVVIDYQPAQVGAVRSMDRDLLVKNIVSTVKLARLFGLPIVHSTVNVKSGRGKPTVSPLGELLKDDPPVDRTSTNAWEDADFVRAAMFATRKGFIEVVPRFIVVTEGQVDVAKISAGCCTARVRYFAY